MAYDVRTAREVTAENVTRIEQALNRTAPANQRSFIRVLSATEALQFISLSRLAAERARQNLALTASGTGLDTLGQEYAVIRRQAEATVLTVTLPAVDDTVIPATVPFTGIENGIRYFPDNPAIASGGSATLSLTAETTGVVGNLTNGSELTIGQQIPGAESIATVTATTNTGAERESDDLYRQRVLFAERATPGGGDATDYKIWAEEVAGVAVAYPFAGKPVADPLPVSFPGDRTVYIQATTAIHPDGLAPQSLLDEVRSVLNLNPNNGRSRPPLGLIDSTLYVQSIERLTFNVTVTGLSVTSEQEAAVQADIETSLIAYFLALRPYVEGIDLAHERNDNITDLSVSAAVQDAVAARGTSAIEVSFNLPDTAPLGSYQLEQDQLAKLGTVTYVS